MILDFEVSSPLLLHPHSSVSTLHFCYILTSASGVGIACPPPADDFVIYEDPDLGVQPRSTRSSPISNDALYQELKVYEDFTDVDIIGKNLNQLLATASNSAVDALGTPASLSTKSTTEQARNSFGRMSLNNTNTNHNTNTTFSESLLAQVREPSSFYHSTGSFEDTGSFLRGLSDLNEDTIGSSSANTHGLDFVRKIFCLPSFALQLSLSPSLFALFCISFFAFFLFTFFILPFIFSDQAL